MMKGNGRERKQNIESESNWKSGVGKQVFKPVDSDRSTQLDVKPFGSYF